MNEHIGTYAGCLWNWYHFTGWYLANFRSNFFAFLHVFKQVKIWCLVFDVSSFTNIQMTSEIEKAFCVLDYARSQSNKTVQHSFVREFSKQPPTAMTIRTWHNKFKDEGCLCRRRVSGWPEASEERRSIVFVNNLARPMEIVTKNKSGNPDSAISDLALPE